MKYKEVLIARFSALGDVAMTVPVVYSVCTAYPDTRFIMITQQVASSLFINAPSNLVVIGVDVKVKYHGVKGMCKLFRELRRDYSIDLFIDLHDVIRTYAIEACCLMSGVPFRRIRKGRSEKGSSHAATANNCTNWFRRTNAMPTCSGVPDSISRSRSSRCSGSLRNLQRLQKSPFRNKKERYG